MSDEIFLQVRDLSVELGDPAKPVRPVDGLNLALRRGETFALVGESGCGKSMTALALMRLLPLGGRIVKGEVTLDGQALLDLSEADMRKTRGGKIGLIFQEPMTSLNPVMRIGQQIAEALRLHDQALESTAAIESRAIELLRQVGIPDPNRRLREYPHQLSGGIKQRVMIAIALAGRPELLIADEPTTALDVTIQAQVLTLLKDLQRETGLAVLLITHDLGVVSQVADRLSVMYAGQIVETQAVRQFFKRPKHPYSLSLLRALPLTERRGQSLEAIPGLVPSLEQVFSSCRFRERCAKAVADCAQIPPWQGDDASGYRCVLAENSLQTQPNRAEDEADSGSTQPARRSLQAPLLRIEDLQVHFPLRKGLLRKVSGHVKAVDGVSLDIFAGKTLALVGESGCGKTTVGKAILRLVEPSAGRICYDHIEFLALSGEELRRKRRDVQIIFQDSASAMNPRMQVGDIIAEGLVAQKIEPNEARRRERVERLLHQVGLPAEAIDRYPHEFSGGQRQRICIARALAVEPKLIVCDEPTSALDVSVQAQILNLLKTLREQHQVAFLFITHNISVVSYLADQVAVMYLGRIVEQGATEKVIKQPRHPYTQALMDAVPEVADKTEMSAKLSGDPPSPVDTPAGCYFHPRCPKAQTPCFERYPPVTESVGGHRVWCHFPDSDATD